MSAETAEQTIKHLETLAREAGVYLSPERISAIRQHLQDEPAADNAIDPAPPESHKSDLQDNKRGGARQVGRPRGSRSSTKKQADKTESNPLFHAGSRLWRLF